MQTCWKNRSLSAHTALHGEFHCNAIPMVPHGTKTKAHNKSTTRKPWDFHTFDAWYDGTAMKYYLCYKVVLKKTGAESTPNNVQFNHHIFQTPKITQADRIHKATTELTKAVRNEPSKNTLEHIDTIIKMRTLLQERKGNWQKGPAEPEAIKIYTRQPNITSKGSATYEGSNKVPPTSHLPKISQDNENDNPHANPTLSQPWYYLCSHALHVAASVII